MNIDFVTKDNLDLTLLALEYATSFWAGAWKELLIDPDGNQYGTYDSVGVIYPDTLEILRQNKFFIDTPDWPLKLWERAGEGTLFKDGVPLSQFWSMDKANKVLSEFITSVELGGYGGEIMVTKGACDQVQGFAAYTVQNPLLGRQLVNRRFPYQKLKLPGATESVPLNLEQLLSVLYPDKKIGIFLDFAISETLRGNGLGSQLFDVRLERMLELGADVMVGRTIKTSPAQYYGNYLKRGMQPIAFDPINPDKAIFLLERDQIKPR